MTVQNNYDNHDFLSQAFLTRPPKIEFSDFYIDFSLF